MADFEIQYFLKELLSNPIRGINIPWENVGDDSGVIATTDAGLIFQLSNFADNHIGGVVRINESKYSELKKNSNLTTSGASCKSNRLPRYEASLLNDPKEVARSAALGAKMPFQEAVMRPAPIQPTPAPTAIEPVQEPKVSPVTLVKRGRGRPRSVPT